MRNEGRGSLSQVSWGVALVRLAVGIVFFMHGWQKLFENTIPGVAGFFGNIGVPAPTFFAAVVTILELVGGLALIVGFLTRPVALLLAIDNLVALFAVHLANGYYVATGGVELVLLLLMLNIGLVLTGPGAAALDDAIGLERRFGLGRSPARA